MILGPRAKEGSERINGCIIRLPSANWEGRKEVDSRWLSLSSNNDKPNLVTYDAGVLLSYGILNNN